uniref:Uncharacterized protein n=1 Tax=Caenorhabditis japonica TaxID=281687 RepID=A0A8R1EH93_CAEJA
MMASARVRIGACLHNPAFIDLQDQCIRRISHSIRSNASSDLDDRVHVANIAKIALLRYNKFTISVINPAFNPNFGNEDKRGDQNISGGAAVFDKRVTGSSQHGHESNQRHGARRGAICITNDILTGTISSGDSDPTNPASAKRVPTSLDAIDNRW